MGRDAALLTVLDRYLGLAWEDQTAFLRDLEDQNRELAQRLNDLLAAGTDPFPEPPMGLKVGNAFGPAWVGPYQILSLLGEGGMGCVFRAKATTPGLPDVAVKVLADWLERADYRRRFQRECAILKRLAHPNIASLLDAGFAEDGRPYFVMPYVAGDTLKTLLADGAVSFDDALRWFDPLCAAVTRAHEQGVVHRDLKPANIMIDEGNRPVLLDFGIAKLVGPMADETVTQTQTRLRLMSLPYAAPEQVTGGAVGFSTDVYQLGVLLFQLLAGCLPYDLEKESPRAWEWAIVHQNARPLSQVAADRLPTRGTERGSVLVWPPAADWDWVLAKALAKNPEDRYTSVEAFRQDVCRLAGGTPLRGSGPSWAYMPVTLMSHRNRPLNGVALGLEHWAAVAGLDGATTALGTAYWLRLQAEFLRRNAASFTDRLPGLGELLPGLPDIVAEMPPRDVAQRLAAVQLARQMTELDFPGDAERILYLVPLQPEDPLSLVFEHGLIHAKINVQLGRWQQAEERLASIQALPDVATAVRAETTAQWWMLQGDLQRRGALWSSAEESLQRALSLLEGESCERLTAACFNELGLLMMAVKKPKEALRWFKQALQLEGAEGPNSNHVVTLQNMGHAHLAMRDLIGAMGHFERAYDHLLRFLPEDAPKVRILRNNIDQLQRAGGKGTLGETIMAAGFPGRNQLQTVEEVLQLSACYGSSRQP